MFLFTVVQSIKSHMAMKEAKMAMKEAKMTMEGEKMTKKKAKITLLQLMIRDVICAANIVTSVMFLAAPVSPVIIVTAIKVRVELNALLAGGF
ncbi:hypothetical protein CVT25_010286 [Psilocybe cyanescens]|uniref:Uncharacterized protein n=1 Tax=Psilocybe cyanescens TaxID=93625 RepID=A0A409X2U2_PSICY|nr:hypothetical protein CVT25_010286 [Psilocybe cyanescens]